MIHKLIATGSTLFLLIFGNIASAQKSNTKSKSGPKFIDDIEINVANNDEAPAKEKESKFSVFKSLFSRKSDEPKLTENSSAKSLIGEITASVVENANTLQLKYSLLLNTEVEEVQNLPLFKVIDEWYGTPYVYGGTTKKGIDCSAFVQAVYGALLRINLPRTAREQHE